jgi:hypothetical protein
MFHKYDHHLFDTRLCLRDIHLTLENTQRSTQKSTPRLIFVKFRGVLLNESFCDIRILRWRTPRRIYTVTLHWNTYIPYIIQVTRPAIIREDSVDLRGVFDWRIDQGDVGSCVAVSLCRVLSTTYGKWFSPLYLFWTARVLFYRKDPGEDHGINSLDALECIRRWGLCEEKYHPYNLENVTKKPSPAAFANAMLFREFRVVELDTIDELKRWLRRGRPISIDVNMSRRAFTDYETGIIPPKPNGEPSSWHNVVLCGYDDTRGVFTFLNSYGDKWGCDGYGYLPYTYFDTPCNISSALGFV